MVRAANLPTKLRRCTSVNLTIYCTSHYGGYRTIIPNCFVQQLGFKVFRNLIAFHPLPHRSSPYSLFCHQKFSDFFVPTLVQTELPRARKPLLGLVDLGRPEMNIDARALAWTSRENNLRSSCVPLVSTAESYVSPSFALLCVTRLSFSWDLKA